MSKAATKLKGREAIYTQDSDNVATIWETLLEDGATEKIRQHIRDVDERITAAKVDMRKQCLHQKVIKHAEIKNLQQEVETLHKQEKAREAKVEEFQMEAEKLTDDIQPMQHKLQGILQLIEKDSWSMYSSTRWSNWSCKKRKLWRKLRR